MSDQVFPAVPGVPVAGHIRRGYWHPGRADTCPKCNRPKRKPSGPVTRHYNASQPVTAEQARDLAFLRDSRQLPPEDSSSRVLLSRIEEIEAGEPAVQYELEKLTDWLKRFPERGMAVHPPGCGLPGCAHHYAIEPRGCICPAWFDGGGYHTISVNPQCRAHWRG